MKTWGQGHGDTGMGDVVTGARVQGRRGHRDMVVWGSQDMGSSSVGPGDMETR